MLITNKSLENKYKVWILVWFSLGSITQESEIILSYVIFQKMYNNQLRKTNLGPNMDKWAEKTSISIVH